MLHSRRQTTFSLLLLFSLGVLFFSLQVSEQNGPRDNGFFVIQADEETSFDGGVFAENYPAHAFDTGSLEINGCSDGTRIVPFQTKDKICFSKLFLSYRKIII